MRPIKPVRLLSVQREYLRLSQQCLRQIDVKPSNPPGSSALILSILIGARLDPATRFLVKRLDQIAQSIENIHAATTNSGSLGPSQNFGKSCPDARLTSLGIFGAIRRQPHLRGNLSPPVSQGPLTLQPSRDYLQIPAHRTTADAVLTWPIFGGRFEHNFLVEPLFDPNGGVQVRQSGPVTSEDVIAKDLMVVPGGLFSVPDERIPALIDNFLQNVHTKNPILDVEFLVRQGRKAAGSGLGWDAPSCLVLLACALGSIARPFDQCLSTVETGGMPASASSLENEVFCSAAACAKDLQQAESCYVLACRRLGLLKFTILGAQCHFFAGGMWAVYYCRRRR